LRHLKLNTPTKILYTGSVYHAQADALRNLIAAIDRLDGEFVLEILSFQDKASLEAQGISGPHVRYASGVSAEDALKAQIDADILFLPLSFTRIQKVVRSSSPLKLGEYLFSGRPVLVHAPAESWVASFFRENKCGAVVDRDDIDELTATLMRLRDDAQWRWQLNQGQRAIAPEFSLARNRDRLWSLLERCRTRRANTPPISFPRYQGDGQPAAALPGREREAVPHAPASPSRLPALPARVLDAEGPRRPLILFVAMQNSPHTARWIEMVADRGWDLRLFPLDPHGVNANLCGVTLYQPQLMAIRPEDYKELPLPAYAKGRTTPVQVVPYRAGLRDIGGVESLQSGRVSLGEAGETAPALHGPGVLASLIRKLQPDLIHSMEFQHAGYLVSQAKDLYGDGFPPWLATNWGSDIFHFAQFEAHQKQIEHLLSQIDYYSCECHRDIKLAHHHGFRGPVMRVLPNTGGFDIEHITTLRSPLPPSKRKRIMIKGYQHFAGRAMTSLAVLESIADRLKDYEIILYSVSSEPLARASQLIDQGVLNIKIVGWADHDEMLSYFGSSRMYMGISVSDAISTSVLEAMAMGAFPIQTDTSCCDEWFEDGIGGFIVSPDAVDQIRTAFLRALDDDALVDSAAEINWKTVERRLDRRILAPQIAEFYKPIFDDLRLFRNQRVEP
jgi:glycosyltransferase involved in cell wall biosynthesis